MLLFAASIVVGSAFPLKDVGDPAAFAGRWVVVAPPQVATAIRDLRVEGFAIRLASSSTGKEVALVNPKGMVVRTWDQPVTEKIKGYVRDWLGGSSLDPDSAASDPRLVVRPLPVAGPLAGWMGAVTRALLVQFPKPFESAKLSRGMLILFLSTRGSVDAIYRERLEAAANLCIAKGIDVLALFPGKDETAVGVVTAAYPFRCAIDTGNAFADAFRATVTPEVYLLDESLRVVYTGAVDSSSWGGPEAVRYLDAAIRSLAEGRRPAVRQTMPFGTTIER